MKSTPEKTLAVRNGWPILFSNILLTLAGTALFIFAVVQANETRNEAWLWLLVVSIPMFLLSLLFYFGHFTLQPNEARVLIRFGAYQGTVQKSGVPLDESPQHQDEDLDADAQFRRGEAEGK